MTTTNRSLLLIDAAHEPGPVLARAFARQGLAVTVWSAAPPDDILGREDGVLWAPQATVPEVLAAHQPFDAVIFNIPAVDEGTLMASGPPGAVADAVADDTSRFFSAMQAVVGAMVAVGRGQIWQMVLEDSFGYYVSVPYSPVSHGTRIGCMRAVAKEVTMFKVLANAASIQPLAEMIEIRKAAGPIDFSNYCLRYKPVTADAVAHVMADWIRQDALPFSGTIMHFGHGVYDGNY